MSRRFYLVDSAGKALDERYERAADRLERQFFHLFPRIDPTDVCNVVEESAKKVASYEAHNGQVRNLRPFLLRVFLNGMISFFREGYYALPQTPLSPEE